LVVDENLDSVSCLTIDVREHNNDIIFLHKIINGVANRSYGIAVAKMAGMPENIVKRAESVLENLESDTPNTATKHTKSSVKPVVEEDKPKSQLSLFG
jgi:DNA mismatch repair protein MutS